MSLGRVAWGGRCVQGKGSKVRACCLGSFCSGVGRRQQIVGSRSQVVSSLSSVAVSSNQQLLLWSWMGSQPFRKKDSKHVFFFDFQVQPLVLQFIPACLDFCVPSSNVWIFLVRYGCLFFVFRLFCFVLVVLFFSVSCLIALFLLFTSTPRSTPFFASVASDLYQ